MKKIILTITIMFNFAFSYDRYKNSYDYSEDSRVSKKCENILFTFDISAEQMDSLILPNIWGYKSDTAFDLETSYLLFNARYEDMKDDILNISIYCENIYEQMYALKRLNYLNKVESTYFELKNKKFVK